MIQAARAGDRKAVWRLLSPDTQRALEDRAQKATDLVGASTRYSALDLISVGASDDVPPPTDIKVVSEGGDHAVVELGGPTGRAQLELTVDGPCHGVIGGGLDAAGYQGVLDQVAAETLAHMAAHPDHDFTRLARDVFDDNRDGVVSAAEVVAFGRELLPPDLDTDDDGRDDALSIAFAFECAPARLATPPTF